MPSQKRLSESFLPPHADVLPVNKGAKMLEMFIGAGDYCYYLKHSPSKALAGPHPPPALPESIATPVVGILSSELQLVLL